MNIEFKKAILPNDLEALCAMDVGIFGKYPADLFTPEIWQELETYWMLCDGEKIGCSSFIHHSDHDGTLRPGSLHIMTTGVLPELQGRGFGEQQKAWQIEYARQHGFLRTITNTRQSNHRMIALNEKVGFKKIMVVPDFYEEPAEPAIVMELQL
jgi:[ribosomal protein S18]-alanine N-acetyltransferase